MTQRASVISDPVEVVPEILDAARPRPSISWTAMYMLVAGMVLIWSGNFIVGKIATNEMPILVLGGLRIQLAAGILLAIFFARRGFPGFHQFRENWKILALLGFFGIAANQMFFILGVKYTSVSHSSLIVSLGPVFVLIMARILGLEKLSALKIIGLLLAMTGVAILVREHHNGQHSSLLGDCLIAAGSLAFAAYVILGKKVTGRFDSLALNTFTFAAGAVMVLPVTGAGLALGGMQNVTWRGWLAMSYMAGLSSVAAYLIFYYGLQYIPATRMSAFSYLQPPIATALSWMLLGESVTLPLVTGGLVIFTGVYLTEKG